MHLCHHGRRALDQFLQQGFGGFSDAQLAHILKSDLATVRARLGEGAAPDGIVVENGAMRRLYCNDSMFDSLGAFYSVISSTQGGWTWL